MSEEEKYAKNVKWVRYGGILMAIVFLVLGIFRLFLAKDILGCVECGLLGLGMALILLSLSSKMEHDLEKEKKEEILNTPEEHDIGF